MTRVRACGRMRSCYNSVSAVGHRARSMLPGLALGEAEDHAAMHAVHTTAFGQPHAGDLVDALRRAEALTVAMSSAYGYGESLTCRSENGVIIYRMSKTVSTIASGLSSGA